MKVCGKYFYGNEISEYGQRNGYVDYATLAKAFDAVLNNDIISKTYDIGDWEQESGFIDNSEEIDEIREKIEELDEEKNAEEIEKLESKIEELEKEQEYQPEIYQYYIVSDNGARILEEVNEIVLYNEELDMYLWGVTHYGTAWSYVLTNIKCNCGYDETEDC